MDITTTMFAGNRDLIQVRNHSHHLCNANTYAAILPIDHHLQRQLPQLSSPSMMAITTTRVIGDRDHTSAQSLSSSSPLLIPAVAHALIDHHLQC